MRNQNDAPTGILTLEDVRSMFGCGRSKAELIMHEVGSFKVGAKCYVYASDIESHIREHGGIIVHWPKRRRGATAR